MIVRVLFIFLCFLSCAKPNDLKKEPEDIKLQKEPIKIEIYKYDSLSIPEFFISLIDNHWKEFKFSDSLNGYSLPNEYNIDHKDSQNLKSYYTLFIMHQLFTSSGARDGSTGMILNIPYFWHWIEPNPRYSIKYLPDNKNLNEITPPKGFGNYQTYADIDRTPYLYLSELVSESPKYFEEYCDTFSTFGWCSEREMAFVCLAEILGYKGKVVAENNHSWSEFLLDFQMQSGNTETFLVTIDNTFDMINMEKASEQTILSWNNESDNKMEKWYNSKAHSITEKEKVSTYIVPKSASQRIERKVVTYLQSQIK